MAGTHITIDDAQVVNALNALLKQTSDMTPILRDIGEMLDKSHDERFDLEVTPKGDPWEYLSIDSTLVRKEQNSDRILTESGRLRASLSYQIENNNTLQFGTNVIYAAVHQFGAQKHSFKGGKTPWGDIPARPFLGLSSGDQARIGDNKFVPVP